MNKGDDQQVDSLKELYVHPKNMFVAEFIGTAQMIFINCKLIERNHSYYLKNDEFKLRLNKEITSILDKSYVDKNVVLGLRPKYINTSFGYGFNLKNSIPFKINLIKHLVDDILVYGSFINDDKQYIISTSIDFNAKEGDTIGVSFRLDKASLFDVES